MFALNLLAITASLATAVVADHGHDLLGRSHHHVERGHHAKRAYSGQATYYAVGLGACGQTSRSTDFIVAQNSAQYGGGYPGPNCFKSIRICRAGTGNCQNAVIMDECPTCGYGSLDMSESLFKSFASLDEGVFPITWTYAGEDGGDPQPTTTKTTKKPTPTPTKEPEPEPTTTWKPEPTTTWEAPTTTSTKEKTTSSPPPETTSTQEPTTSSTSSTPTTTSTTEARSSSSATPTTTSTYPAESSASAGGTSGSSTGSGSSGSSNLADANEIVLGLGYLALAADGGH